MYVWTAAMTNNPQWLIGRHAHKFFPEWNGICRAIVNSYNANRKLWTVTYEADNEIEEFDYDDMMKFVVDRVCGTAAAEHSQKHFHCTASTAPNWRYEV
jgi:hypothetical protein